MYVVGVKASMIARNLLLHTCAPCAYRHQVMPHKTKLAGPGLRRASCRCRGWLDRLQAMHHKTRHAKLLRHAWSACSNTPRDDAAHDEACKVKSEIEREREREREREKQADSRPACSGNPRVTLYSSV